MKTNNMKQSALDWLFNELWETPKDKLTWHSILKKAKEMDVRCSQTEEISDKKIRMIDPPSGWRYGFPKPIPDDVKDVEKWLIENGYPKELIDELGDYFYCRYWEKNEE